MLSIHRFMLSAAIVAAASPASWSQCTNDAGAGDTAEDEACPLDETDDTTNGGCNSTPAAFTDVAADGGLPRTYCGTVSNYNNTKTCDEDGDCPDMLCVGDPNPGDGVDEGVCEGPSEPSVNRRDTDWYLLTHAALTARDTDGNGTVRIRSAVTGEAGLDLVTFFLTIDGYVSCNASVLNNVGCWDSTGGTGQTVAEEVITLSEEPFGVVVFVAPGLCTGAGIFDGFECATGLNDYTVMIDTDPAFEDDPFTVCGDPAQNPQLGPCGQANPGVNGCEDPNCCYTVCTEAIPQCCYHELGWIQQCADAAIDVGCAPECFASCGPLCLETGVDSTVDGYAKICADPYGSWSGDTFGGSGIGDTEWGDAYNPIGALDLQQASFTNGFFFFRRDGNGIGIGRELLSNIINWQELVGSDNSLERTIIGDGSLPFDDDGNGVFDRFESDFVVFGAGVDLEFHLTQKLDVIPGIATVMTQTLVITNDHPSQTANFTLVRSMDGDMVWDSGGDPTDDTVGTDAIGSGCMYVWQGETGLPGTFVTISSNQATGYFGAKAGVDPDGAGACPPMTAGSDLPLWDAYGVPCAWENYIAGVGASTNGESGPAPAGCTATCDGSIGLEIPVTGLAPGASTTVIVNTTYGAASPLGSICDPSPCPWDCGGLDGEVGIEDFLAVLAQWDQVGTTCDLGAGTPGVGIEEFLGLLANWGPCP